MKKQILTILSADELRQLIREEFTQANPGQIDIPDMPLSFEDGCAFIGISKSHGYKLTSKKLIPHFKRGKRIYFNRKELEAWLLEKRVPTIQQMEEEVIKRIRNK